MRPQDPLSSKSWRVALGIGAAYALAGIAWMLFVTGTTLSVPALTGAIMTMGVATANSVLVISFARERLEVLRGLQQVLSGEREHYQVTYPCHSPTEQRWYAMHASALRGWSGPSSEGGLSLTVGTCCDDDRAD